MTVNDEYLIGQRHFCHKNIITDPAGLPQSSNLNRASDFVIHSSLGISSFVISERKEDIMIHRRLKEWVGTLVLSVLMLMGASLARADDERDSLDAIRGMLLRHSPGEYWLGIACGRASSTLRSHLQLANGAGLVIQRVIPDSAADNAGLQTHDVILKFGTTDVGRIRELSQAIDERKGEETLLTFVRYGRKQTVRVTPAKRKSGGSGQRDDNADAEQVLRWLEEMYEDAVRDHEDTEDNSLRFRFFHPGTMIDEESDHLGIELPKDLKIAITNPDDGPAKILIEKNGESWELSTDDLDWNKLPAGMQRYIEFFLGPNEQSHPSVKEQPADRELPKVEFGLDEADSPAETSADKATSVDREGLQTKLDSMEEQLRRLREEFRQLRNKANKNTDTDN